MDEEEKNNFIELKEKLEKYNPLIPEEVLDYFMVKNGVQTNDKNVKKLISSMVHKFLTDVSINAFQFHKIHTKANLKDKRFAKEKKVTLTITDLERALKEMGIDVSRPHYFL